MRQGVAPGRTRPISAWLQVLGPSSSISVCTCPLKKRGSWGAMLMQAIGFGTHLHYWRPCTERAGCTRSSAALFRIPCAQDSRQSRSGGPQTWRCLKSLRVSCGSAPAPCGCKPQPVLLACARLSHWGSYPSSGHARPKANPLPEASDDAGAWAKHLSNGRAGSGSTNPCGGHASYMVDPFA